MGWYDLWQQSDAPLADRDIAEGGRSCRLRLYLYLCHSQIYQVIFSSDNEICAELFYLKWKFGNNEGGNAYAEKVITKYHKALLKNHQNPFIFKFYYFISNKNPFYLDNIDQDEMQQRINRTKITLLNFMINTLNDHYKEIKSKKDANTSYINNLLNILIALNEELNDKELSLFKNNSFYEIFYKYISLLDKTCLLYSNYYLEFEKHCGKIVCEVIYDIFFKTSEFCYNEQEFMKAFTKENRKEQEIFTIFYLIDIFTNRASRKVGNQWQIHLK